MHLITCFQEKVLLACSVAFISSPSLLTPVTRRRCSQRSHPIHPSSDNYDILMERWVALLTRESPWLTDTRRGERRERNSLGLMTAALCTEARHVQAHTVQYGEYTSRTNQAAEEHLLRWQDQCVFWRAPVWDGIEESALPVRAPRAKSV